MLVDKWAIINTRTNEIVNVFKCRKAALVTRKELNRQSYFNKSCDNKNYRYRIIENPTYGSEHVK